MTEETKRIKTGRNYDFLKSFVEDRNENNPFYCKELAGLLKERALMLKDAFEECKQESIRLSKR